MSISSNNKRIDSVSRVIKASPQTIYKSFIDPEALVSWLPPKGMKGQIYEFDATNGGAYRMSLTYTDTKHAMPGKSSENTDIVKGRYLEFVPNERIVQLVEFESADPAYAGTMIMTWIFAEVSEGTEVTIVCENVPEGIRQDDHLLGMNASLENLALFTE
ncbi:SRPBCC family protein [Cohnella candidum]|uniref:ATPase n=1 Tax=Cohnella candidum TaxID=2674991 RepID=A0A3G3JY91_9BACL|nr:SRPBCC family protein [Cohnella candidum]AYQ72479.1 ATPase [Cohnella candidum]